MENKDREKQNNYVPKKMMLNPLCDILKSQKGKLKRVPKICAEKEDQIMKTDAGLIIHSSPKEEKEKSRDGKSATKKASVVPNPRLCDPQNPHKTWECIKIQQKFHEPIYAETAARFPQDYTRVVCISDTHSRHRKIHLPPGDILIHGGDITSHGEPSAISDLCKYFQEYSEVFDEIICIAGNHDVTLHSEYYQKNWKRYHRFQGPLDCAAIEASLKNSCIYLRDSEYKKEVCSNSKEKAFLHFYGSPWSPFFYDWAFNLDRGAPIQKVWKDIPSSTDVLVTHGPPLGRGDLTSRNIHVGCFDLLMEIQDRIVPRVHIFGHIHEGAGVTFDGQTLYVNASNSDFFYQIKNYPIVIDVPHDKSKPARLVPPDCKIKDIEDLSNWCKKRNFVSLSTLMIGKADNLKDFPFGNQLFDPSAYGEITNKLEISVFDRANKQILQQALSILYAESFPEK